MTLANKLKKSGAKIKAQRSGPVWEGPSGEGPNGGITQSLLSRFLCCRERFRLLVVEGLKPEPEFNIRLEYGNIWHCAEEAFAANGDWQLAIKLYCSTLAKLYQTQQTQVEHWYNVARCQFPIYVDYWKRQPDVKNRTPLMQEQVFDVPYELPSGRVVRLRGKFDSVDLIGGTQGYNAAGKIVPLKRRPGVVVAGTDGGIYLQENKTKGDINEQLMKRQLTYDLQTGVYLTALHEEQKGLQHKTIIAPKTDIRWKLGREKIAGVRYNVIRRPLSGGKYTIKQYEPTKKNPYGESKAEFYQRLQGLIKDDPGWFFMRWKTEFLPGDLEKFKRECLNPILEQLCDWWEVVSHWSEEGNSDEIWTDREGGHFRMPYGVYNPTLEGRASEVDEYLASGSTLGLTRVDTLFGELE